MIDRELGPPGAAAAAPPSPAEEKVRDSAFCVVENRSEKGKRNETVPIGIEGFVLGK